MDMALDGGDLASADKIAAAWGKDAETAPLRALRLARLARYEGQLDQADALSQTAMDHGTVTPRVLWERVFVLVARRAAPDEVGPLLSHYPLVLGPLATWLSAYATASNGNTEGAKGTDRVDRSAAVRRAHRGARRRRGCVRGDEGQAPRHRLREGRARDAAASTPISWPRRWRWASTRSTTASASRRTSSNELELRA